MEKLKTETEEIEKSCKESCEESCKNYLRVKRERRRKKEKDSLRTKNEELSADLEERVEAVAMIKRF